MTGRLDIDAMRAFQAVAGHGGVTRAAEHLSLSQSAVSHKIKRLEEGIDCLLLNRRAGAPLLTEAGERLLAYAGRMLALHDEALASLSKRALSGAVRFGMTEDMSGSGLARILGRFARLFPDVSVNSHVAQSLVLQKELEEGSIDLAAMQVFSTDVRPSDRVLYETGLCWARSVDLQLAAEGPVPFLSYDDNCFYRKWMLEQGATRGRPLKTVLQCSSNGGMIAAVEAGLGVSILNRRHVSPAMVVIEEDFICPPDISYVVRINGENRSRAVAALADEIVRENGETGKQLAA